MVCHILRGSAFNEAPLKGRDYGRDVLSFDDIA